MNKPFISYLILLLTFTGCLFSSQTNAKEFMVAYEGFYDRLKVVNKGNYTFAEIGFYLSEVNSAKPCQLKSGEIVTELQNYPLVFTEFGQILLPFDKELDYNKAVIKAQTHVPEQDCQLSMQIETKVTDSLLLNEATLFEIYTEQKALIGDLSGVMMRTLFQFMMPKVTGISILFSDNVDILSTKSAGISCEQKKCTLLFSENFTDSSETLKFSSQAIKVIPYIEK